MKMKMEVLSKDAVRPGDTITRSYIIENHLDTDPYRLSIESTVAVSTPSALKSLVRVTLIYDDAVIYDGNINGDKDRKGNRSE